MRTFDSSKYRGLDFSNILHSEVNADLTDVAEGDVFINYGIGRLIYKTHGFLLFTNNSKHYLTSEDLKCKFVNERKQ